MRYLLIFFIAFISCGSPETPAVDEAPAPPDAPDTAIAGNVSLPVPEGWEVRKNYEGADITVISPAEDTSDFRENFNVITAGAVNDISLEDYYSDNLDYLKSNATKFELLNEGEEAIDNTPAKWFEYKFDRAGKTVYGRQYFMIKDNKAYAIHRATYATQSGAFERKAFG